MQRHYRVVEHIKQIYNFLDKCALLTGKSLKDYILDFTKDRIEYALLDHFQTIIAHCLGERVEAILRHILFAKNIPKIYNKIIISIRNRELKEVIELIITSQVDDRIYKVFFKIALRFIDIHAPEIMKFLKRYISLETFLSDLYNIFRQQNYDENNFDQIEREFMNFYTDQQPSGGKFEDCSECTGKYYVLST